VGVLKPRPMSLYHRLVLVATFRPPVGGNHNVEKIDERSHRSKEIHRATGYGAAGEGSVGDREQEGGERGQRDVTG
jgi:hypothetical protein